ncbi:MAG TPA: hypothetical protein VFP20_04995 [Bacteroidales bacterium]|nr:hypothetical protein [Bacteroidales bacterium]
MKKTIFSTLFLLLLVLSSCSNDNGSVKIISLNTFGNKVCLNDNVKVFVSAQVDDIMATKYTWECTGGTFTNPAGLFENVWKAPNTPGEYELSVTVESNGVKETRKAKITVLDEYFYSNFETPYYSEGYSNTSMSLAQQTDGSMMLTASADNGRWLRNWNDTTLYPPYSMQLKYKMKTVKSGNYVKFRYNFARVVGAANYATTLDLITIPSTGAWSISLDSYDLATGAPQTTVLYTGTTNAALKATAWTQVAMSIDADLNLTVYCNGTQLCNINNLKTLADTKGYKYNLASSGMSLIKSVVLYVDDLFIYNNGTICTGTAITR